MYCEYYSLKEDPFNVTSDPSFFYSSQKHKEALSHLFYGVTQRKGIIAITGEIGTGKTILCRFFLKELNKNNVKTAFLLHPCFLGSQLLEAIVRDFGIDLTTRSKFACMSALNKLLLNQSEQGNNVVLIIDEAQNLTISQLEQIRLLSNLETQKSKLIQIVLVGQPELNHKLGLYSIRQLQQRITIRYHITSLNKDETVEYINHRLHTAGGNQHVKFTDQALQVIFDLSKGNPRLINIICDRALLTGFFKEIDTINEDIINHCTQELNSCTENLLEKK
ncbi:MAG: AAA family ATPase [Candidatus Omnitrophota bacterium]